MPHVKIGDHIYWDEKSKVTNWQYEKYDGFVVSFDDKTICASSDSRGGDYPRLYWVPVDEAFRNYELTNPVTSPPEPEA